MSVNVIVEMVLPGSDLFNFMLFDDFLDVP